jgi:hypothetical protein
MRHTHHKQSASFFLKIPSDFNSSHIELNRLAHKSNSGTEDTKVITAQAESGQHGKNHKKGDESRQGTTKTKMAGGD